MRAQLKALFLRLVYKIRPMAVYEWSQPHYWKFMNEEIKRDNDVIALNRERIRMNGLKHTQEERKQNPRSGIGKTSARSGVAKR